jgi:hypothetical protein
MKKIFLFTLFAFSVAVFGCEKGTECGSDTGDYAKTFKDSFTTALQYDSITIAVWSEVYSFGSDTILCTIARSTSQLDSMKIEATLSGYYLEDVDSLSLYSAPLVWDSDTLSIRLNYSSTFSNIIKSMNLNSTLKTKMDGPLCAVARDKTKIEALRFEIPPNTFYRIISYTNPIKIIQ